ncbi:MAG: hypothetical protein AAB214_07150, partial [Fibrobacterota bacterium]
MTTSAHNSRTDPKVVLAMVANDPVRSILQNVVVSFGQTLELHTSTEAFLARLHQADVVVIDISSPVCKICLSQIQMSNAHRPVIVLASLQQRVECLEAQRL